MCDGNLKGKKEICVFNYDNINLSGKLNSTKKPSITNTAIAEKCLLVTACLTHWRTKRSCRQEPVNPAAYSIRDPLNVVSEHRRHLWGGRLVVCVFISPIASYPLSLKILSSHFVKQIGEVQFAPLHFGSPVPSALFCSQKV